MQSGPAAAMWKHRFGIIAAAGAGASLALVAKVVTRSGRTVKAGGQEVRASTEQSPSLPAADWSKARNRARVLAECIKEQSGSPGLLVAVAVDGELVYSDALGLADVENAVQCSKETRMRIASVSKPITMLAVARLWEDGKLDLDAPVQRYVPSFPEKTFDGEPVTITTRQLVSHVSGIRHYEKAEKTTSKGNSKGSADSEGSGKSNGSGDSNGTDSTAKSPSKKKKKGKADEATTASGKESSLTYSTGEYALSEYHIKEHFDSVEKALMLFANDDLIHRPGSKYLYSTHGWTLVSAVVEGASEEKFLPYLTKIIRQLGLGFITPEYQETLVYGRAR